MKKHTKTKLTFALFFTIALAFTIYSCNTTPPPAEDATASVPSEADKIARGKYLVSTVGACNDCHSPKIFMPDGTPMPDTSKLLSGHPAGTMLPKVDTSEVRPGKWYLISSDLTAFVGPWGISYSANLTPDSTTGIGAWTEENFIGALRKGKHLGQDGGRPILPPMPWYFVGQSTDDDLKAIFAYLKSLKPVANQVPPPTPPTDLVK